jgi:hypothetical protein
MNLFIYHHLGLGDHIVCNGMVRELIKNVDNAYLFCKGHNKTSVEYMYRDCKNLTIIIGGDDLAHTMTASNPKNSIVVGGRGKDCPRLDSLGKAVNGEVDFVQTFYRQAGVPLGNRYNSWSLDRDTNAEKELYDKFGISDGEEYIFVHDDSSRDFEILSDKLPTDIKIVRPQKGYTGVMPHYAGLIENAKEVHCIDSSFRLLTDQLNPKGKLYFHKYSRKSDGWVVPTTKLDWTTIN